MVPSHQWWCWCNVWRLKCKATKTKEPYLSFLRELTAGLFAKYGSETKLSRPAHISLVPRSLKDSTRLEDKKHLPAHCMLDGKVWRKNCKYCTLTGNRNNRSSFCCIKCEVPLHIPECFMQYHTNINIKAWIIVCLFFYSINCLK